MGLLPHVETVEPKCIWLPLTRSPSSANFYQLFWLGGLPYENRLPKKGTLILTSLLEDLVEPVCSSICSTLQAMRQQLQDFRTADTTCACCQKEHKEKDGKPMTCDRHTLVKCLRIWFGSEEEFEQSVQQSMQGALMHHLGGLLCSYHYYVVANLPALWMQMDFAAGRWYAGNNLAALESLLLGVVGVFVAAPAMLAGTQLCVQCTSGCRSMVRKLLAAAVCTGLLLGSQGTIQLCLATFDGTPLLGGTLYGAFWLLPSWALWRSASSKLLMNDRSQEPHRLPTRQ